MNLPNVHAITLRETTDKTQALRDHLKKEWIAWRPFIGCNAVKWGLETVHTYELDNPGKGERISQKHVGLHLSHYWLWRIFQESNEYELNGYNAEFTVIEDDARFIPKWKKQYESARALLPDDWDLLFLGSCCVKDREKQHIGMNLYKTRPFCTHAYVVRGKSLDTMIETQEKAWANVDIALWHNTYPKLNVYAILPRIVNQDGVNNLEE